MCNRRWLAVLLVLGATAIASPCRAAEVITQTRYFYDRWGNLLGLRMTVQTDTGNQWVVKMDRREMALPVRRQLALIDAQVNLGPDVKVMATVLQNLKDQQQRQAMQRQQDQLRQMQQQMDRQRQLQQQLNQLAQQRWQPPPPPVFRPIH